MDLLALGAIPITYVLFTLHALRTKQLYPKLPSRQLCDRGSYCLFSLYCSYYMNTNYMALGKEHMGMWDPSDMLSAA